MPLFRVGLLTGIVEPRFTNPRIGLGAHLEGVMKGIFPLAPGAVWTEVRLPPGLRAAAFACALYGTCVNRAVTTLAAVPGTAALSPVSAAGYGAGPRQEGLVTFGILSVGINIVACALRVLWGPGRSPDGQAHDGS